MTQTNFIKTLSKNTGIDAKTIAFVLDSTHKEIVDIMKRGDTVAFCNFGTFMSKQRAAKRARNISAGTFVDIPARRVPYFKPSRELAATVISATTSTL